MMANITQCGLGIYLVHYFVVGGGYALADYLQVPVLLRIPVTAIIAFVCCWGFVAACYKWTSRCSKKLFG